MNQKQNIFLGAFLVVLGASLMSTGLGWLAIRFVLILMGSMVLSKGLVLMTGLSLMDWFEEAKRRFF